jgi:hypothetical protein
VAAFIIFIFVNFIIYFKIEQELNSLGIGDVRRRGGENNNSVWKVVSKRCIDTERQKMEANMRGKNL